MKTSLLPYIPTNFTAMVEPIRDHIKTQKKDLATTLREINHEVSIIGVIHRFCKGMKERRVLHTLTTLPKLSEAIANDLEQRADRFYELMQQRHAFMERTEEQIGLLLEGEQQSPEQQPDYTTIIKGMRSRNPQERHTAYASFLAEFRGWVDRDLHQKIRDDTLAEYPSIQEESKVRLIICYYLHTNLKQMASAAQRKVEPLILAVEENREIIITARNIITARKALLDIREKGNDMYTIVQESYDKLGEIIRELRNPYTILLTSSHDKSLYSLGPPSQA